MAIRTIDLDGVPEKQAEAIEDQVRYWKHRARLTAGQKPGEIPVWKGKVIGPLTREELYVDE